MVAGLLLATGCGGGEDQVPPDLPAIGGQVAIVRVPAAGGRVEAYDPDSLATPIWSSRTDVPAVREVLGINPDSRLLMAVDESKNLFAIDLEARGLRQLGQRVDGAAMAADGSVYSFNADKRVSRFQAGLPSVYRTPLPVPPVFQTATLGNRYIAVVGTKPRQLLILGPDQVLSKADVGDGPLAATPWADLVAVARGSDVDLFQTEEPFASRQYRAEATPTRVAFSPSGHRLYVAHDDPVLEVVDRYSLARLTAIRLPGAPAALRLDATGRWLLARADLGDSTWVVDLATNRLAGTVGSDWTVDLPTVAGAGTLLASRDGDLAAIDLTRSGLPERGRISGAADDFWLVTTWLPRERKSLAAAAAESVLVAQDSALVGDTPDLTATQDRLYLQVSHSQNAVWSRDFAKQLTAGGYPARVIEPANPDDGYRVVIGPYPTRDDAEEAGRKLDRPYFVLTNPPFRQ
ncbi:MAG: SPOR domain-containing protein [Gemmatimonadales bacterium]